MCGLQFKLLWTRRAVRGAEIKKIPNSITNGILSCKFVIAPKIYSYDGPKMLK